MKINLIILRKQKDVEGTCMIYLEFDGIVDGKRKRKRIPTNIRVCPNSRSTKNQRVLSTDKDNEDKNQQLDLFLKSNKNSNSLSPQKKQEESLKPKNVIQYFDSYIEFRKARGVHRQQKVEYLAP